MTHLYDYITGEDLGEATDEQVEASEHATTEAENGSEGDTGTFEIDANGHPWHRNQCTDQAITGARRLVYVI